MILPFQNLTVCSIGREGGGGGSLNFSWGAKATEPTVNINFSPAHELRTWLLHYSPVVLHGILMEDYYQHHLLLVGVYLLLKDVVKENIEQSSTHAYLLS